MADIRLDLSLDIKVSKSQFRKDLAAIFKEINNDPHKIKVVLEEKSINALSAKIDELNTKLQNLGSGSKKGGGSKNLKSSINAVYELHRQMNELAKNNKRTGLFKETNRSFKELQGNAKHVRNILDAFENGFISADKALKKLNKNDFLPKARTNMAKLKDEMSISGKTGTASEKDINGTIAQMTNLLGKNSHLANGTAYQEVQAVMNRLKTAIETAKTQSISLEEALKRAGFTGASAIEEARLAVSRLKVEAANTPPPIILAADTTEQLESLNKVIQLKNQLNDNLHNWSAAKGTKDYDMYASQETAIDGLISKLQTGQMTSAQFADDYAKIVGEMHKGELAIRANGNAHKSLTARLAANIKKFGEWFGGMQAVMTAVRYFKEMIQKVIELDTAMTELKKVTEATDEAYENFLVKATDRAKKLGSTVTDIVGASSTFARLGFDLDESEQLADAAIVYKNVGDGIENIDQASESIIATMQAYGIEAENVMSIIDKFNEVGNNFAISSSGVGDALLRSAAAMKAAGNTIDETIALATAANTVVQLLPRWYGNIPA